MLKRLPDCRINGSGIHYRTGKATMNQIIAVAFGGLAMIAASTAHGQERSTLTPATGYMFGTGTTVDGSPAGEPRSSPLFTFGGLDVHVWAPMEPHYNAEANRDAAAEPFWGMD
jgi:hypothetical protein